VARGVILKKGPEMRLGQLRHVFKMLPPMTLRDLHGVTMPVCGRCFQKLGDDPFNGQPGEILTSVAKGSRCGFCGHKAWPVD